MVKELGGVLATTVQKSTKSVQSYTHRQHSLFIYYGEQIIFINALLFIIITLRTKFAFNGTGCSKS